MKPRLLLATASLLLLPASAVHAQRSNPVSPAAEPATLPAPVLSQTEVPPAPDGPPAPELPSAQDPSFGPAMPDATPPATPEDNPEIVVTNPPGTTPPAPADPATVPPGPTGGDVSPVAPPAAAAANAPKQDLEAEEGGYRINDAALNDIFQFLAKQAGRQYFHNMKIAGPEYRVTGHLNDGNPVEQLEELAFMYGLTLYTKGNTIYALTQAQLGQLPGAEFHYQLKYLRPTDIEAIKALIQPVLTPGAGIVNFEPKTNTIIIIDSAHRIEQAETLLRNIDRPKGQIVVETKILRVNSATAERVGIDWSASLGESGASIEVARSLNSVFGLRSVWDTATGITTGESLATKESAGVGNNVVLSPLQLNGVLRALASGGLATQISNPTLITEDNEKAAIAIIDRVPIITSTVNQTESANNITEEVRYKVDASDPDISKDPDKHREIGISLTITPTVLPDGTVRMALRPRSAQIVEQIQGQSGNFYPRVSESMIESIARVPDGHSLVVGGFYGEVRNADKNKVPILGDIPLLNFFFKSRETEQEKSSLVFVVTPTSYDPSRAAGNQLGSGRVSRATAMTPHHDWIDMQNPGPAHEPNLARTIRGVKPLQAPYYAPPASQAAPEASSSGSKPRYSKAKR